MIRTPRNQTETPLIPASGEIPDVPTDGWECEWCCHDNPASAKDICENCRRPPRDEPEPTPEPTAKRTRRPKGPPDEIDKHIAAIQTARHEVKRCDEIVRKVTDRLGIAYGNLNAARANLKRLTAGLTPPPETETANPEE